MDFMENMVLQRLLDNGLLGAIMVFAVLASLLAREVSTMMRGAAEWGPWLAICGLLLRPRRLLHRDRLPCCCC